jgi:hypothetical protein
MSSATPIALIASGYASTTNPCVLSYSLLNSDATSYSGSDLSIDSSSGSVSIVRNVLFSANLIIRVTSTNSTSVVGMVNTNSFTVDQVCGSYCTPTITGILSSYNFNV